MTVIGKRVISLTRTGTIPTLQERVSAYTDKSDEEPTFRHMADLDYQQTRGRLTLDSLAVVSMLRVL